MEHVAAQRVPWEIFRGHLLDPAHARESAEFEAWNLFIDDDQEPGVAPLVSIKWQRAWQRLFIVRQILTHGFEAYEDSPGVILTREVQKWVAELAGTIDLELLDADALPAELATYIFLAVIGSSRLPITSLESPLPAFSLGRLAYLPERSDSRQEESDPIAFLQSALAEDHKIIEQAKALEIALRAIDVHEAPSLMCVWEHSFRNHRETPDRIVGLFRAVFNTVALSPYTGFAGTLLATLRELASPERLGPAPVVDLVSYMLRHLCRHLTAFDLTLFHSFGANYPDALFLDALLKAYLQLIDAHAELFIAHREDPAALALDKRRRRRALRQACLVRKQYEGHRVPDAPTSMGENLRVLPPPFARVPEEQILQLAKRRRVLFEGDPLEGFLTGESVRRVHQESLEDLVNTIELSELGMAHFLDRPMGIFKEPGEVDRTPLLSYEAFSRSVLKRRLAQLKSVGWLSQELRERYTVRLDAMPATGVPVASLAPLERPGVASLADAQKVAADFVLLRATSQSRREFMVPYDVSALEHASLESATALRSANLIAVVQHPRPDGSVSQPTLRGYDGQGRPCIELGFPLGPDKMPRYRERSGVELVAGWQILRVWSTAADGLPKEFDLRDKAVWLKLR
ncbi:MAG: hypothetical protein HY288_02155 [Planctomycetia bacterium]|nr:hypothetical protein [Planctomycetia bacterium]